MTEIFKETISFIHETRYLCRKEKAMTIRKNVEYLLKLRGMNKSELAELAGVSYSNLTRYLDSKNIGLESIRNFAKVLGVKPSDLISTPPLSDRNKLVESGEETVRIKKPINISFVCQECGTKYNITITED